MLLIDSTARAYHNGKARENTGTTEIVAFFKLRDLHLFLPASFPSL
jgi:hypothetical protein